MIRSMLFLHPSDPEALEAYFRADRVLERATAGEGCLEASLLRPTAGQGPVLVTALWSSAQAYGRWVTDPWRQASSVRLSGLLTEPIGPDDRGALYELVHHAP